jgi:hypothetical protein
VLTWQRGLIWSHMVKECTYAHSAAFHHPNGRRVLMEEYLYRPQKVAEAAEARTGMAAVSALELLFQR